MGKIAKMLGAGMGAAIASVAVFFLKKYVPDMDAQTLQSAQFLIYQVLTMGGAYVAPANTPQ